MMQAGRGDRQMLLPTGIYRDAWDTEYKYNNIIIYMARTWIIYYLFIYLDLEN